jgi:hypothetical protein
VVYLDRVHRRCGRGCRRRHPCRSIRHRALRRVHHGHIRFSSASFDLRLRRRGISNGRVLANSPPRSGTSVRPAPARGSLRARTRSLPSPLRGRHDERRRRRHRCDLPTPTRGLILFASRRRVGRPSLGTLVCVATAWNQPDRRERLRAASPAWVVMPSRSSWGRRLIRIAVAARVSWSARWPSVRLHPTAAATSSNFHESEGSSMCCEPHRADDWNVWERQALCLEFGTEHPFIEGALWATKQPAQSIHPLSH